jgi:ABC-2 type transport system permease protein
MKYILSKKDRALFAELVRTDFKLRYQGSVLGYVWTLLKPLLLFGILFIVFTKFLQLGRGVPNYPQSLLLGIVLWTFFVEATNMSLKSVVARGSLIRKINIPKYLIPLSVIASAFINMSLNLIIVFVFVYFAPFNAISLDTLWAFPLLLLELAILASGVGFFLAAVYAKYQDIDPIWEVARQALFYTMPLLYPISRITNETIQKLIMLNPLSQIIQDSRKYITYSGSETITTIFGSPYMHAVSIGLVSLVFIIGVTYFNSQSKNFAENV